MSSNVTPDRWEKLKCSIIKKIRVWINRNSSVLAARPLEQGVCLTVELTRRQ